MNKKRKKYLVTVDSEAFACSLVTNPAVEEMFVSFSEDKPLIEKFADEKKHMITGVVAIPQKPIFRRGKNGEEFDIVFSAEAIEKMSKDFLKNYRQSEVTLQHQEETDGVYLVEQWIKSDDVYDKSIAVGLSRELPVGSWIQTYYVDSNDVWERIQNGELRGFSLECALGLQEFESQIDNNMIETNDMKFWTKMKEVLSEVFSSASMMKEEETKVEPIEPIAMEDLEAETASKDAEATNVAAPTVVDEPKVEEPAVEQPKAEDAAKATQNPTDSEPKVEEPKVEEPKVEEPKPTDEAPKETVDVKHLEELINSMKSEIAALKELNGGLKTKVKELEKQPSVAPVNTNAKPNANDTYSAWREQMAKYL